MRRGEGAIIGATTFVLVVMLAIGLGQGDPYVYVTTLVSISLIWIPPILAWRGIIELPYWVLFAAGLALILHSLGLVTNWYSTIFWWDKVTHMASGIAVGSLVAIAIVVAMSLDRNIFVPNRWIPFFVFVSVLALETGWEILEFTTDQIFGTQMQHGLLDTVNDITTNVVSGAVVGVAVAIWLSRISVRELVPRLRIEKLAAKVETWGKNGKAFH